MTGRGLSIVIPALNEEAELPRALERIRDILPDAGVIVADGGSMDRTLEIANGFGAQVVQCPRGRGRQCASGADHATGRWLLFLHADTLLPRNAGEVMERFVHKPGGQIATFRLQFDAGSWFLRACAWCSRIDSVFTRFGDQGILVHRAFYTELGGFPHWPLMEDVELLRRARRLTRVCSLPAAVETSARRFRKNHEIRQQLRNAMLLIRFLTGTSPEILARAYDKDHPPAPARSDSSTEIIRSAR